MNDFGKVETYTKVAKAIEFISAHQHDQPSLAEVARSINLSESRLQRLFSQWVGISPKQFLKYQTKQYAKEQLKNSSSVLSVAVDCGLSGTGRLHDLMLTCEGMTPGEYKTFASGLEIFYGVHESPFGYCLLAMTKRGVCKLSFFDELALSQSHISELFLLWPNAIFIREDSQTQICIEKIFGGGAVAGRTLHMILKGSPFQIQVWEALMSVPESSLCSYQQLADKIGSPNSVRAVASAVAKNNLAYLIPCHRVIKSTGDFNQYRWGKNRKKAMIMSEGMLQV